MEPKPKLFINGKEYEIIPSEIEAEFTLNDEIEIKVDSEAIHITCDNLDKNKKAAIDDFVKYIRQIQVIMKLL